MTAIRVRLRRFLISLAWLVLALGLMAGLLSLASSGTVEYLPIVRAALGLAGLGVGYVLGQALRPLGRWRPPVPATIETAAPLRDSLGHVWLRGFAAGFWALAALGIAASQVSGPLTISIGLSPAIPLLLFALGLVALVPMTVARAMVADGAGLPQWTLVAAALTACSGGLGLFLATGALAALLGPLVAGPVSDVATLLALAVVPVIAVGTPVLAHDLRPSLRGPAWSGLLALLALWGAWLLATCLGSGSWINSLGFVGPWLWLLPASVLWGSSFGAVLAVAIARRRADLTRSGSTDPRRVSRWALVAGALGLFLLGLVPLAVWLLTIAMPGLPGAPVPQTPLAAAQNGLPDAAQPGLLPLPGPALLSPTAGAAMSGRLWTFVWRPPSGATSGELYQFSLWPPNAARPAWQLVLPSAQMRITPSARPSSGGRPSGPWTWRVRVVQPGQGAGQWSEARPFTPIWSAAPGAARR